MDSDGTNRPYRCSIRAPGFAHLAGADFVMRRMCFRCFCLDALLILVADVSQELLLLFYSSPFPLAHDCRRGGHNRYYGKCSDELCLHSLKLFLRYRILSSGMAILTSTISNSNKLLQRGRPVEWTCMMFFCTTQAIIYVARFTLQHCPPVAADSLYYIQSNLALVL